ncbi:MAG TPA: RpiB/LacA/LacB family sugar-phosphate isomerase [Solirubrobacteraceae bacterium]|nr:RpiB/LacA/LacB family sugar-phosphate isomerase [Solirubrobacteraceae bacterium]
MRVSLSADELTGVAGELAGALGARGATVRAHGALAPSEPSSWAAASIAVAREVAAGDADLGVVCCWTGTGASIAANKVAGVRAALCADAATARGARRWNDANVLALSLRTTTAALLEEILDAFLAPAEVDPRERASIELLARLERGA